MGRFLAHDLALEAVDRRESKPVDCKRCRGHQRFRQIWLMFNHPVIMMIPVLVFLALAVWLMLKILRFVKCGFQALRDRMRGVKPDQPASTIPPALPT